MKRSGSAEVRRPLLSRGESDVSNTFLDSKTYDLDSLSTTGSSYGSTTVLTRKRPVRKSGGGMFRFATFFDWCLVFFGTLASVVHGAGWPILSIVLGGMTNIFLEVQTSGLFSEVATTTSNSSSIITVQMAPTAVDFRAGTAVDAAKIAASPTITISQFESQVTQFCLYYAYIGVAMFITSYIQIACWESASERQVHKLRKAFFKSLLGQEIGWFDTQQTGQVSSRLNDDLERIREGIGDKASLFIQNIATFVAGYGVGFFYSWKMTLVMMALSPLIVLTGAWMARVASSRTQMEQEKYAVASGIAEETLSSIRTVFALNGQKREQKRFEKELEEARKSGLLKYFYMGIGFSASIIATFSSYGLAFWFASTLILNDPTFDRGSIFTVFLSVMSGSASLGGALPNFSTMAMAHGASRSILDVLDTKPDIDPYDEGGRRPAVVKGRITFKNVRFSYPVRKDIKVLKGLSFSCQAGKKIAFVGPSGCGKSTIVNLLLRYYDPDRGHVRIDDIPVSKFNVGHLRSVVGVVSQEPILFDGTLEENIRLGREDCTTEQIIEALKLANAYNFINLLPQGLKTRVGERGVQLSGGQKQRIAIARSLVRNPRILLLDEATSALDTESEAIVQKALDQAQEGRTTLTIAHRLSTIKDADHIIVLKAGETVEQGTYQELIESHGHFYKMLMAQELDDVVHGDDEEPTSEALKASLEDGLFDPNEGCDELSNRSGGSRSGGSTYARRRAISRHLSSVVSPGGVGRRATQSVVGSTASSRGRNEYELRKEVQEEQLEPVGLYKIASVSRNSWVYAFIGLLGSSITGVVMPLFALFFTQIFQVFSETGDKLRSDAIFWSLMFVALGLLQSFGWMLSANGCGRAGENLTLRLRSLAFENLLRQDVAYFDDERHNTGKICTRLATDVPNIRYVFTRLPSILSAFITIIAAIVLAFWFGWKLALLVVAMFPLIMGSGYFELKMQMGKQMRDVELMEESGKVAIEAVENIRTVQALTKELTFYERYVECLRLPFKQNMRQAQLYALVFGFAQSVIFFMYAAAFRFGAFLVVQHQMEPLNVFRVFFAVAFCGQSVGQLSSFIPDIVKAKLAAALVFKIIERPTKIDSLSELGETKRIDGSVNMKNIHFSYPTRPTVKVLQGLNLNVEPGKTVALVGPSGCGKSTVVSLLERFYDVRKGSVLFGNTSVRHMNLMALRSQMALVSQEPMLFDCSIRDNICYGVPGNVTHQQIVDAATVANIHEFILSLPMGYETPVGEKGTQLSGGQKQRVAIARALVRNPTILLLDEATSALDTESEKVVQEALDNAREGRTCIVIAHRLSSIQNADQILVINDGKVAEKGTHSELLTQNGLYTKLCNMQKLVEE